jgi:hypothetical protein
MVSNPDAGANIPIAGIVYKGKMKLNKLLSIQGKLLGANRDMHGCIGSAGYAWCEKTGRCERPWKLASKQGFENTMTAFDKFCNHPVKHGK